MQLNKVLLAGNLTRDPELRYLNSGTAVCELGMATNRRFQRNDGEQSEEVCFVNITVWGRQGENCNQYLKKGAPVFVEGRLKFDSWQGQDGQKRSKLSVVAERVQFLRGGGPEGGGGREFGGNEQVTDYGGDYNDGPSSGGAPEYDSEVPF